MRVKAVVLQLERINTFPSSVLTARGDQRAWTVGVATGVCTISCVHIAGYVQVKVFVSTTEYAEHVQSATIVVTEPSRFGAINAQLVHSASVLAVNCIKYLLKVEGVATAVSQSGKGCARSVWSVTP